MLLKKDSPNPEKINHTDLTQVTETGMDSNQITSNISRSNLCSCLNSAPHHHIPNPDILGIDKIETLNQLLIRAYHQANVTALGQQALLGANLSDLLRTTVTLVTRTLQLQCSKIWQLLSDGNILRKVASSEEWNAGSTAEINVQYQTEMRHFLEAQAPIILGTQEIKQVITLLEPNLAHQDRISAIIVPIPAPERPLGLLVAYTSETHHFTPDEIHFLQAVTEIVAMAIARRRSDELLYVQTQMLEKIATGITLQEVFQSLCSELEQQSPGAICSICLVDPSTQQLRIQAAPSLPRELVQTMNGMNIREGATSCGTAAYRKEAVFATDIATDPIWTQYREIAINHKIQAWWSIPFFSRTGEVLGTFVIAHQTPCEPTTYHLQLIKTATHLASLVTEQHRATEQLKRQALYDALTGLPNRVLFMEQLQEKLQRAYQCNLNPHSSESPYGFAVLFLDVDRFKLVNDSLGHQVGDELLKAIARRVERCIRPKDTLARLAGDEFAILVDNILDVAQAELIADRIRAVMSFPIQLDEHKTFTSVSIGIAHSSKHLYKQAEQILQDADTAMYRAKAKGREGYAIFDQTMHKQALSSLQLETDLRHLVEDLFLSQTTSLQLYYQPIVSLLTGRIAGFEALLRWGHPERGLILPPEFLPIAEETGLIVPIGRWVVQEACCQLKQWQERLGTEDLTMSVNVSGRQFWQPDFITHIQQIISLNQIKPSCLKLEITETVLMEKSSIFTAQLEQLQSLDICLSLDDFGTGYSCFGYLHRYPIHSLKIDPSFVQHLRNGREQIVGTIIRLAHGLEMEAIAEGVETLDEFIRLKTLGCEFGQGYLFGQPMPAEATEMLFTDFPQWLDWVKVA